MAEIGDLIGVVLHALGRAEMRMAQMLWASGEAVVRGMLARVVPDASDRLEYGPITWSLEYLDLASVPGKPRIGRQLLVIRRVVLNQRYTR